MRYCALFSFVTLLLSCGSGIPPGAERILLTENIKTAGVSAYQVYYELKDSAAWEKTLERADTIVKEEGYLKLRSDKIWYEFSVDSSGLKAQQPYPGWERAFDSIKVTNAVVYSNRWERLLADVPAEDVALGPDSIRIAIVHVLDRAFKWQRFKLDHPDYIMLSPPGGDSLPLSLGQDNIGPITNQTIFRVGRKHYALTSVSEDRRELVIESIRDPGDIPLAAQVDLNYRQVSVYDLNGEPRYIKRKVGGELILFFTSIFPGAGRTLSRLDSFYHALPASEQAKYQVEIILQQTTAAAAKQFLDTLNIQAPVSIANDRTCLRLNCRSYFPYYVGVNNEGRITTFWGKADDLTTKFERDSLFVY